MLVEDPAEKLRQTEECMTRLLKASADGPPGEMARTAKTYLAPSVSVRPDIEICVVIPTERHGGVVLN